MLFKKLLLCTIFFLLAPGILFVVFAWSGTGFSAPPDPLGFAGVTGQKTLYAALPRDSGEISAQVLGANSVPVVVDNYLKRYGSKIPAAPLVELAESSQIDPRLIVAIAQQESNLGKNMPAGCHNAWGFGIHSRGTLCFASWEQALSRIIPEIAERYCQRGLCDDPCAMMKVYTPRSNGSWCAGVKQFLAEMETGDF